MTTENDPKIVQSRSPRAPSETLKDAITRTEKLLSGLGRGAAPVEAVAKALGFTGLNGASRSAMASLSYYGFLTKQGTNYKVSDLALRIIRPISPQDRANALAEAHLLPKLFAELQEDYRDTAESVLSNVLLQKDFTQEGAKRAAYVFKDNLEFLRNEGYVFGAKTEGKSSTQPAARHASAPQPAANQGSTPLVNAVASYSELPVPIGDNMVARVPFPMTEDDFDLLIGTLNLWKKKLVKKPEGIRESDIRRESQSLSDDEAIYQQADEDRFPR